MNKHYIVWPEYRYLSEDTLIMSFSDAVANGDIADEFLDAKSISDIKHALSDAGIYTFGVER